MPGTAPGARMPATESRSGLDGEALKLIAIFAMTVDHIAYAFVEDGTLLAIFMHAIGRITGPVMFYLAAEGYHHTRSVPRYILRLAVFALISFLPFQLFVYGRELPVRFNFLRLNVLYTILLGVLAVWVRHEVRPMPLKLLLLGGLILLAAPGDWGTSGVLMILTFEFYYGAFPQQAFAYILLVLLDMNVLHLFTGPTFSLLYEGTLDLTMWTYGAENLGLFLPLLLLRQYNGQRGRHSLGGKWLFYVYYPAHLIVLGLIRVAVGV